MTLHLNLERLLELYRCGCFPMGDDDGEIRIYRYDPRTIMPLDQFHVPKRMARELKAESFELTINQDFEAVIGACASVRRRSDHGGSTWINSSIVELYCAAHRAGYAHSVETRFEGKLVGGLYGIALGGAFFGESMFHFQSNASKFALIGLVARLRERGYELLDCQMATAHTARFGTINVTLSDYLERLRSALEKDCCFSND